MVRPNSSGRKSSGSKPKPRSSTSNNADQALARQQRKNGGDGGSNAGPQSIHDVYDYATQQYNANGKGRQSAGRGKVERRALAGADVADAPLSKKSRPRRRGEGESEDDKEDDDVQTPKLPRVFQSDDEGDGPAAPNFDEHDSDIDSDEAFGESDEERFADWHFKGSSKKNGPPKDLGKRRGRDAQDEEEEEAEESEDEDDEDMMDLSKMLDGDDDEGEDDDESVGSEEEDGDDEQLMARMSSFAAGQKRSADSEDDEITAASASNKRARSKPEGGDFFDFSTAGAETGGSSKITIEDLLKPIEGQKGMSSLRASARALADSSSAAARGQEVRASRKGAGTLAAPLPGIVQDRLDRSAAYDVTKKDVQGWQATIKRLREAEHLSFPLQSNSEAKLSTAGLVGSFKSAGYDADSLEGQVQALLTNGGLSEKQLKRAEELQMKELDPEEVKRRHAELRRMRELMFRAEQKAKRVKKIKSKTFRKVYRKEKERERQKLAEAGLLNGGGEIDYEAGSGDEEDADRLNAERRRAEERATLKHKNQGKWAKTMLGRKELPADARQAIHDQLARGDELRKKIQGIGSDEDSDDYDEDSDAYSEDEEDLKQRAFDELAQLEDDDAERDAQHEAEITGSKSKSGVLGMKFMRDARERERQDAKQMAEEFRREMEGEEQEPGSDQGGDPSNKTSVVNLGNGRAVYGTTSIRSQEPNCAQKQPTIGKAAIANDADPGSAASLPSKGDGFASTLRSQQVSIDGAQREQAEDADDDDDADPSANPWLNLGDSSKSSNKLSKKHNIASVSKTSNAESKALNRVSRHKARGDDARKADQEDATLDIDLNARLGAQKKNNGNKAQVASAEAASDGSELDSDAEADEIIVRGQGRKGGKAALQQKELIAEAFAGDDVAAEFAAEKAAIMEAEAPREEDTTLPGWGSWGGKGAKKSGAARRADRAKKFVKVIPGLDPSQRKDAGMDTVIINQKRDKKAEKYKAKDLPFPYTSAAQYEMAMRTPIGPEWNTRTQHQRMTLPRVTTKPGKVIKPIERKF